MKGSDRDNKWRGRRDKDERRGKTPENKLQKEFYIGGKKKCVQGVLKRPCDRVFERNPLWRK